MSRYQRGPTGTLVAAAICATLVLLPGKAAATPMFAVPSSYLGAPDSPFAGGGFSYFYIEDFEDGALNTPGVAASGWIVLGPAPFTDSVDADDGAVDGSGTGGHSFYSRGPSSSVTFTFDATALGGHLPTHVGIVWTDVGSAVPDFGVGNVSFSALDGNGMSLGSTGPFSLGDGNLDGGTAEDRFFGVVNPGGISQVSISMSNSTDWEVDHLQYGFQPSVVPEPSSLALLATAMGSVLMMRRRSSRRIA